VRNSLANVRAVGELAASVLPWVPTRGPSRSSDITAEWLTTHLGAKTPGAVALSATPLEGTTGTTDRRRLAVQWNDAAFERYRLFSAEAWDATAMTIAWPGLQAPENAEAGWRRACVAVEDLDTASAVNSIGK
jgi:hypothetical protein